MTFCDDQAFELLFTSQTDADCDEAMVEEMYWSMIQRHPYHVHDPTVPKNIYSEPNELADEDAYTTFATLFPFQVKLDPEVEELNKYGYDRTRDAIVWFSSKIMRDLPLVPKLGDRFDYTFINANGDTVLEHFEIHEISDWDFARQSKIPYQISAAADRTQYVKKP